MFPTFISILDIQSWWEVPSIAHFCSLFRTAFNLLDFDIEDLEEALLTDGTEETSWLQELIVRLLSGCIANNEISTFNYQMFLRRLFRQKCQEHERYNPFNTDVDFTLLPLRTKVDILHALCDFRLDAEDVLDQLKNLEADSLRVEPLGYDSNDSAYWYFYGTRLYREDFKTKNNKKKSIWQVICFTEDDWIQLTKKFKSSTSKAEKSLHQTLSKNFLPELPRLFKEKESQARRRLLENQPRRTSSRLRKVDGDIDKEEAKNAVDSEENERRRLEKEEKQKKRALERQKAYERRTKLKEQSEDSFSEVSESRYEMAKTKKSRVTQRKISSGSTSSRDNVASSKPKRTKKSDKNADRKSAESVSKTAVKPATVGRQTNNSLSAADGQIVIQPVSNPVKKKLKTSQVFRQTDEDLQVGMHKILDYVKNDDDAWPFADPVEEEYAPNYYSIIRKPMDLQRMEERLDSGYYKKFSKFRGDFQLIVNNCRLYNGVENEYTEMVDNLLQVFEKATEKYLDQISSSDDEIAIEYLESETTDASRNSKKKKRESPPRASPRSRKPVLVAQTDKRRNRSLSEESIRSRGSSYESIENVEEKPKKSKKAEKLSKKQAKIAKLKKSKDKSENKKEKLDTKKENEKTDDKKEKPETKKEKPETKKEKTETKKEKTETKKEKSEIKDSKKDTKEPKIKSKKNHGRKKSKKQSPVRHRSRSSSRSPSRSPPPSYKSSSPPPSWPPSSTDSRFDFSPAKKASKKRQSQEMSDHEEPPSTKTSKNKHKSNTKWIDLFEEDPSLHQDKKIKQDYSPYTPCSLSPKPKDKHNKLRETIEKLKAKSDISRIKSCEYDFEIDDHPKENKDIKNKKPDKDEKTKNKSKEKSQNKAAKKDVLEFEDENSTVDSLYSDCKKSKKHSSFKPNIQINKTPSNLEALSIATEQTLKDINKWLDDTPKFADFSSASNSPSYTGLDDFDALTGAKIEQKKPEKPTAGIKKDATVKDVKRRTFRDPAKFFKRREVQRTIDRLQPGKSKGNLISNVQSNAKTEEIFPLGPLSKIKDTKNSLIVKTNTNAPKLSLGSVLDSFGKHKFVDDQKKEEEQSDLEPPKPSEIVIEASSAAVPEESTTKPAEELKEETPKKDEPTATTEASISGGGATPNLSAWFKAFGAPKAPAPQKKPEAKPDDKEETIKSEQPTTKVPIPDPSPTAESPQPIPRQRRISTGSSISERSSFSQDMDSPRVGMDERGAYPAPYPSPLHRSPSGASPVMASPRPDFSPKSAAYPAFNGQMRVGFYQDTVSNKSSPDKPCSPQSSPYVQYSSDHVYAPNTTQSTLYSYANSPYYTHTPNYSSTNPTPPYNTDASNPSYYDTSKSLTDQYQAKTSHNYTANSPSSSQSSPAQRSPIVHPQLSPSVHSPHSPSVHSPHSPGIHSQHSPNVLSQHSPHPQMSPNVNAQQISPSVLSQMSPNLVHSPTIHPQMSPNVNIQQLSPNISSVHSPHPQQSPMNVQQQNSPLQMQNSPAPNVHQEPSPVNLPAQNVAETFHQQEEAKLEKIQQQPAVFPVKKRAYSDLEPSQFSHQSFEHDTNKDLVNKSLQMGHQAALGQEISRQDPQDLKQYPLTSNKSSPVAPTINKVPSTMSMSISSQQQPMRNNYPASSMSYNSSFNTESGYPLNIPSRTLPPAAQQTKIDLSKFTNMGYSGPEVNFSRALQQQYNNYVRTTVQSSVVPQQQNLANTQPSSSQADPNITLASYKNVQQAHTNFNNSLNQTSKSAGENLSERLPPTIDLDQPLGLGRNISNISHIVDRYGNDERLLGLQTSSYYAEKTLTSPHIFNKSMAGTGTGLPMFSQGNVAAMQSYSQSMQQQATSGMYNRQMQELQSPGLAQNDKNSGQQQVQDKKKKRKSKAASSSSTTDVQQSQPNPTQQGFQSYAGLKNSSSSSTSAALEPSAISLKTSSVVPGSAFNFGPTPTGLGMGSGLYGDKDGYQNFLEDFRSAPNYYMAAAAAAHHRTTPETSEKQGRPAHQASTAQAGSGYSFLGAHQGRPGAYPIGGPFIPSSAQAQLMDTSSPLYQHYLQAGVLNQGLLGPPGAYPPGYHAALSMRQSYDSMTRPSWL